LPPSEGKVNIGAPLKDEARMAARPEIPAEPDLLHARYTACRAFSLALTESLATEDFVVQSMPDVSPTKWHLAHTSWFFENFLLQALLPGYRVFDEQYNFLFNSYYYQVGQMHLRAERGLLSRPPVETILEYRRHVDAHMAELIAQRGDEPGTVALITLGIHHEQQHQELMLADIKHVFSKNPLQPVYRTFSDAPSRVPALSFIEGPADRQYIGHDGAGFAYDNEGPEHEVILQPYAIANRLVTNREYREFIADGGYQRAEFWLSNGWTTVTQRGWNRPFYWLDEQREFTLGGVREINPDEPVSHLSYFEADAFASWAAHQWRDARLPNEAEWEAWARQFPIDGNFADSGRFHPAAASADDAAATQVYGDVWQWTRSAYSAYPGYRASSGAIGEYNGKFMCGQMVLRGGSCASSQSHIRPTYRNFFYPADQWQFTGLRLARDL
jgi:ergothioneine biosynthesis protein EgtB